jgi:DNA-binding transcriptional MerR regulator
MSDQMQIGEVAERTGLSLRTIRYYGEMGLVPPSARSGGGFRLYSEADVDRFRLIMRMKPLDFTLEEMKGVLDLFDALLTGTGTAEEHAALVERLATYRVAVENRVRAIRAQLDVAEEFAAHLEQQVAWHSQRRVSEI